MTSIGKSFVNFGQYNDLKNFNKNKEDISKQELKKSTKAIGEEGGSSSKLNDKIKNISKTETATTMALGEEGGSDSKLNLLS